MDPIYLKYSWIYVVVISSYSVGQTRLSSSYLQKRKKINSRLLFSLKDICLHSEQYTNYMTSGLKQTIIIYQSWKFHENWLNRILEICCTTHVRKIRIIILKKKQQNSRKVFRWKQNNRKAFPRWRKTLKRSEISE